LKDYDHIVVWLDYFNKNLTRRKGRRISSAHAVFDPTLGDLTAAATAAGYEPLLDETADQVRYPRRPFLKSGYIILPKSPKYKKSKILEDVAQKMHQLETKKKSKER
jgi:signal recognition particle subunit SRP19